MHALCGKCAIAPLLRELVADSRESGECSLCGEESERVLATTAPMFIRAVKALIRYHYSEWDYHRKLGGNGFEGLLKQENLLFRFRNDWEDDEYEDFLLSFIERFDSDYLITLVTAYGRDIYNYPPMSAVALGEHSLLSEIELELQRKNHFLVESAYGSNFHPLREHVAHTIPSGEVFYRARIGAVAKAANYNYKETRAVFYDPFRGADIGAPPVGMAAAGRLNRPGVSFLYLASDMDTAIAEVRPHPGEFVSVGAFTASHNIAVANFSDHDLGSLFRNDKELRLLELIVAVEKTFAAMAPPSNQAKYSVTQVLAEIFRRMGFGGIRYKSTVGNGVNLAIFAPDAFHWNTDSASAVKVEGVTYQHTPCLLYNSDNDWAYHRVYDQRDSPDKNGTG